MATIGPGGQAVARYALPQTAPSIDAPRGGQLLVPTLIAALICGASISRFPGIDDLAFVKVGISLAEFGVLILMYAVVDRSLPVGRWLAIAVVFVVLRFGYGWLIAYLQYDIAVGESFQEARFGIAIMIAPVAYAFWWRVDIRTLNRMIFAYLVMALVIDFIVYLVFVRSGQLYLAQRGGDRYVLSVLAPLTFIWLKMVISNRAGKLPDISDAGAFLFILFHIFVFTTSRTEAILSTAVLVQWFYLRFPSLRVLIFGVTVATTVVLSFLQNLRGGEVAGRDFNLALYYIREAFPFGAGLISQSIQNSQLSTDSNFLVSDYGIMVLVYRYGVVGFMMAAGLFLFWLNFTIRASLVPGNYLFALAILFYLGIIPVLDYGSMNGGLVLGALAAVVAAITVRPAPTVVTSSASPNGRATIR